MPLFLCLNVILIISVTPNGSKGFVKSDYIFVTTLQYRIHEFCARLTNFSSFFLFLLQPFGAHVSIFIQADIQIKLYCTSLYESLNSYMILRCSRFRAVFLRVVNNILKIWKNQWKFQDQSMI